MIYPTLGISIFAHMFVIGAVKLKNFLGFKMVAKDNVGEKVGIIKRVFLSMGITAIVASVSFLVLGSSFAAVYVGIFSSKSNFNIIKTAFYQLENKASAASCISNNICYSNAKPAGKTHLLNVSIKNN